MSIITLAGPKLLRPLFSEVAFRKAFRSVIGEPPGRLRRGSSARGDRRARGLLRDLSENFTRPPNARLMRSRFPSR